MLVYGDCNVMFRPTSRLLISSGDNLRRSLLVLYEQLGQFVCSFNTLVARVCHWWEQSVHSHVIGVRSDSYDDMRLTDLPVKRLSISTSVRDNVPAQLGQGQFPLRTSYSNLPALVDRTWLHVRHFTVIGLVVRV